MLMNFVFERFQALSHCHVQLQKLSVRESSATGWNQCVQQRSAKLTVSRLSVSDWRTKSSCVLLLLLVVVPPFVSVEEDMMMLKDDKRSNFSRRFPLSVAGFFEVLGISKRITTNFIASSRSRSLERVKQGDRRVLVSSLRYSTGTDCVWCCLVAWLWMDALYRM